MLFVIMYPTTTDIRPTPPNKADRTVPAEQDEQDQLELNMTDALSNHDFGWLRQRLRPTRWLLRRTQPKQPKYQNYNAHLNTLNTGL